MTACPSCGTENPAHARFCLGCGAALEQGPPAGEERKLVTVLFADLAGSTALGERLDAEALKEVMGRFFTAMREQIEAEGGTVEKFIGDAVMAAFGVPVSHEDDPSRALRAALRMQRRLQELNRELEAEHGVELGMRIGVNTGEVLASTAPRPGEAMATGDAVNVGPVGVGGVVAVIGGGEPGTGSCGRCGGGAGRSRASASQCGCASRTGTPRSVVWSGYVIAGPPGPDLEGEMRPEPDRYWTYERTDPADWEARPAR
jgi:hypothetical protein